MRLYLGLLVLCFACGKQPTVPSLDAAKAASFVAYQEQLIPLERKWAKAEGPVPVNQELETLLAANGLTEKEVSGLNEIGAVVTLRDAGLKKHLDAEVAEQQRAVDRAPESSRDAAQKSLDNLKRMRANMIELAQMRQKYGDAIVDAMLAREAELKRQRLELASIQ